MNHDEFPRKVLPFAKKPLEGMSESMPIQKAVAEVSEYEESRAIERQEVIDLIQRIAQVENISPQQLKIAKEVYDKESRLVRLEVAVDAQRSLGEGWGNIEYVFSPKGYFGEHGSSNLSAIYRLYSPVDRPHAENAAAVGIVARYENDEWQLHPGHLMSQIDQSVLDPDSEDH